MVLVECLGRSAVHLRTAWNRPPAHGMEYHLAFLFELVIATLGLIS